MTDGSNREHPASAQARAEPMRRCTTVQNAGFPAFGGDRFVSWLLMFGLLQWLAVLPTAAEVSGLKPAEIQKLQKGEALVYVSPAKDGNAGGRVTATIDIPVSPKLLWKTMLDCSKAAKFIAGLTSCRVIELGTHGTWDIREHIVQWIWLFPKMRSVFRSDYKLNRQISFRRVGGDLKRLEGEWVLEPLNENRETRLHYRALVDVGIAIPGAIVRAAIERDVPRTLKAIRHEAVSSNSLR